MNLLLFSGVYDLHSAYNEKPMAKSSVIDNPLVPLDPSILLPYHLASGRIPATFWPRGRPAN